MSELEELKTELRIQKNQTTMMNDSLVTVANQMAECTLAMRDLTIKFAVYIEKHDTNERVIKTLESTCKDQQKQINVNAQNVAVMSPTVESMRGMVWKIITALFLGMGGVAAIVAAIPK